MTQGQRLRLDSVQALRAIACILVAVAHASATKNGYFGEDSYWVRVIMQMGVFGVDLFFLISGFIIFFAHQSDFGQISAIPRYLKKRLVRIYPPFLIVGVPVAIFLSQNASLAHDNWNWASSLFLYPDIKSPALAVGWSLEHEMIFYAIFLLMLINVRIGLSVFAIWSIVLIASIWLPVSESNRLFNSINLLFVAGGGVFFLHRYLRGKIAWILFLILLVISIYNIYIFVSGLKALSSDYERAFVYIDNQRGRIAPFATIIVVVCIWSNVELTRYWGKALLLIGDASYSIYLLHTLQIFVLGTLWRHQNVLPTGFFIPIAVIISVFGGVIFHLAVERPLINKLNLRTQRNADSGNPITR